MVDVWRWTRRLLKRNPFGYSFITRGSATAIKDRDFAEESITVAKDSGKRIYKVTRTDGYKQPAREIETSVNL